MSNDRVTISWDELKSDGVEEKLKQVEAVARAQEQYRSAPPPEQLLQNKRGPSLWYNTILYMSVFGLIGSLLGWAGGTALQFRPNPQHQAAELIKAYGQIETARANRTLNAAQTDAALNEIRFAGRHNPYFQIYQDSSLSDAEKQQRTEELIAGDRWKQFLADLLFYGICGMMIATALGVAEPVVERNYPRAAMAGTLAAMLGLIGGLAVALFQDRLYSAIATATVLETLGNAQMTLARIATWAVLGLFLSVAPGVALRNYKKLKIGIGGGLLGGIVGGLVYDPIRELTGGNEHVAQLVALLFIGVTAGAATGFIENIAKSGWLRVAVGLIAGKQFVLYRNPTYIGSAPQCQIFLFKDPHVGRRHAAVHVVPGGFELEDLPLGGKTYVNGREITRSRLRTGDRVQIGSTIFTFQEKARDL
jgi:hypothetical protein